MASIEFIQKRIAGKEKEIEKLEKRLSRIRKAEATGWVDNPYFYSESDLRWALRDLEAAKDALAKYRNDLTVAEEKANSRNVPAILEFLEKWKARCIRFYGKGLTEYFNEKETLYQMYIGINNATYGSDEYKAKKTAYEEAHDAFNNKAYGYYEEYEYERYGRKYKGQSKVREGEYEFLKPYSDERTLDEAMSKLAKDLNEEANRKYDFIVERTNAIVGEITDASGLTVGSKDDLNGYIIGTRGTAKVQTIGAGGYNIQCFHFRTLINKA